VGRVRHRTRNSGTEGLHTERWDSPAPIPGSTPRTRTAWLITPLHPPYPSSQWAEELQSPPCRKNPTKEKAMTQTQICGGSQNEGADTLWIFQPLTEPDLTHKASNSQEMDFKGYKGWEESLWY
jgi:hypothetical protein